MARHILNNSEIVRATDVIYATVMACGRIVYRATYAGMTSIEDVVAAIRRGARSFMSGPVTVLLRNGTQGWTSQRALLRSPIKPEATQLTLF